MSTTDATERMARCGCGKERPSSLGPDVLAFLEDHGPDSRTAREACVHCHYTIEAHDPEVCHARTYGTGENLRFGQTVVEQGKCPGFEPRGAAPFDTFYCGCRGWN